MTKIKGVVFDMDGVIVDSEPIHFECTIRTLKDFEVLITSKDLVQYVGVSDYVMWGDFIHKHNLVATLEDIQQKHTAHRNTLFTKENIIPIEGTIDLIESLSERKIKIGLASSSPKYFIENVLDNLGIRSYFHAVVSGDEVKKGKPAPDVYIRSASLIDINPSLCMAIDDAKNGVLAAKSAGMYTLGYKNPNTGNQDLSAADQVISQMYDVIKILDSKALSK